MWQLNAQLCFISLHVSQQWSCFPSPVNISKERNSFTTELRSSTRTSPPRRRAWWEILWIYPTLTWRVPASFSRGLWWVVRYWLTFSVSKTRWENGYWSVVSPSPAHSATSISTYSAAAFSEYACVQSLFWAEDFIIDGYKKNCFLFHEGGSVSVDSNSNVNSMSAP